jgi:hypothetical protein
MIPFYYSIKAKSDISEALLDFAKTSNNWIPSHGFDSLTVPDEIICKDKFIADLSKQFSGQPSILRMPAKSMYDWHSDGLRSAAINLLLEGFDSYTFFGFKLPNNPRVSSIVELAYEPDRMYLLNTQTPHGVYNRTCVRTVFSLGFYAPYNFNSVLKYISQNE